MTRAVITAGAEVEAEAMIVASHAATETAISTVEDVAELEVEPVLLPATIGPVMTEIAGTVETVVIEATAANLVMLVGTAATMAALALVTPPTLLRPPRTNEIDELFSVSSLRIVSEVLN